MPTDNSGTARVAKLRRISASQGPVPPIRPNIGSQALDALLGRMDCCPTPIPIPCNPQVYWQNSPIQLSLSPGFVYSALYATVISNVPITPLSGQVTGYNPPGANITVQIKNSGVSWKVIFTSDMALSGSLSWVPAFIIACNPPITSSNTLTLNT